MIRRTHLGRKGSSYLCALFAIIQILFGYLLTYLYLCSQKRKISKRMKELALKYGCNPNQKPSRIFMTEGELPIEVINGRPGYINFLDAFNAWLQHFVSLLGG